MRLVGIGVITVVLMAAGCGNREYSCGVVNASMSGDEITSSQDWLASINQARGDQGLPPLIWSAEASEAAHQHNLDMCFQE